MPDIGPSRGFRTPPDVTSYFEARGLRPSFSWADVWNEEHAYAFTVAKATELELLTAFKRTLGEAIARGHSMATWRASMVGELRRLGWAGPRLVADPSGAEPSAVVNFSGGRRLQTIFWANVSAARSAGQWERAQRAKAALPYAMYVRSSAADPRREHLSWTGTILPLDDPWWQTHWPPNGWACSCTVRMVTGRERDRLMTAEAKPGGLTYRDAPPDDGPPKTFVNKRTGEISTVPAGIDPGWGTNPGLSRARTLVTRLNEQLAAAGEADARAAIAEIAASPLPRVIAGLPEKVFLPVAVAPPSLSAELGGLARIVEISSDTLRAKIAKHRGARPVTVDALAKVQEVVDGGTMVDEGRPGHRSLYADLEDGWWQAVVKAADRGQHYILSTFHAVKPRALDAALKREAKVRGD